jgi:hypothetical protein
MKFALLLAILTVSTSTTVFAAELIRMAPCQPQPDCLLLNPGFKPGRSDGLRTEKRPPIRAALTQAQVRDIVARAAAFRRNQHAGRLAVR